MINIKEVGNIYIRFDTGAEFVFEADDDMYQKFLKEAEQVAEFCKNESDPAKQANRMLDAIDTWLGEGATAAIFNGVKLIPQRVHKAYGGIAQEFRRQYVESFGVQDAAPQGAEKPIPFNVLARPRM